MNKAIEELRKCREAYGNIHTDEEKDYLLENTMIAIQDFLATLKIVDEDDGLRM